MVAVASKPKRIFFPLTKSEWLDMSNKLKPSELKVYFFLKTLNPFGDRFTDVLVKDIAAELNLNRSTVSRCLRRLAELGLIEMELVNVRVKLLARKVEEDGTIVDCDRQITERDRAIAQCDRAITVPIYNDRAREKDFSDFSDPPLAPPGENQEGGEIVKLKEEKNSQLETKTTNEQIMELRGKIEMLTKCLNMGQGKFSAPVEFHQKNIKIEASGASGAPIEFHQKDIFVDIDGAAGFNSNTPGAPIEFHQEDVLVEADGVPVKFHQEDIEINSPGSPISFHQKNITVCPSSRPLKHIPQALLTRLGNLGIPFDEEVVAALQIAHKSQVLGALTHCEKYKDSIKSPKSVFLYQLRKQPVDLTDIKNRLQLWQTYWFSTPHRRPLIQQEIQSECLSGEVVIPSEEVGPVLAMQA